MLEPLGPGGVYTIGFDLERETNVLFRIEVQPLSGSGRLILTGLVGRTIRDSLKTAFDFLRANASHLGISKPLQDHDLHVQAVELMSAKESSEVGVAFLVALVSALLERSVREQTVVLGEMTIHGGVLPVRQLPEKLQLALNSGGRYILLPAENRRHLLEVPDEILGGLELSFYGDPVQAIKKALNLTQVCLLSLAS